jgi:TRAP-type C4-dicarboxylate transport system substrate-binding protein
MRAQWREWEQRAQKQAEGAGNQIVAVIDKQPFEAAMKGIYDATLAEPRLRQLVDRIREAK